VLVTEIFLGYFASEWQRVAYLSPGKAIEGGIFPYAGAVIPEANKGYCSPSERIRSVFCETSAEVVSLLLISKLCKHKPK